MEPGPCVTVFSVTESHKQLDRYAVFRHETADILMSAPQFFDVSQSRPDVHVCTN